MGLNFRILPAAGLVYVRYGRIATVKESQLAFAEYTKHPDFRPAQKQFVDLSAIEAFESNFVELIKFQAKKAEAFHGQQEQTLLVYFAPTDTSFELAKYAIRAWSGLPNVIATIQQDEAEALEFLGRPERSLAALLTETTEIT